jgi:methionine-S-sulfoxide reductase
MFSAIACAIPGVKAADLPEPKQDLPAPAESETTRTAIFAGGCFWCVEAVFEQLDGVSEVVSGYIGDSKETANYDAVCSGDTKHAEAVKIVYDPRKITYAALLRVFFTTHDPTTLNRQGPDAGTQYRSAIFFANDQEKAVAAAYIGQLAEAKSFAQPIVTTLEPLGAGFFPAEKYHQDFAKLNPNHGYVRQWSQPKVAKVQEKFPEKLKK